MSRHTEELHHLLDAHGEELPLDRTLLLLAKEEYPEIDVSEYVGHLDALADRVREAEREEGDFLAAVRRTLFFEAGFSGDGKNYYDPQNSLLNVVLDKRRGIPITLAVVYLEVCRRLEKRAVGIGFPGHFLVQHELCGRPVLIDPFDRGAVIGRDECALLLKSLTGNDLEVEPWMLAPCSPRSIVSRVLTGLKHAYVLNGEHVNAVRAIDRLLIVQPRRIEERRDRGYLFASMGCAAAAIADLEAYLEHDPDTSDLDIITKLLPRLRTQVPLLN